MPLKNAVVEEGEELPCYQDDILYVEKVEGRFPALRVWYHDKEVSE